MNAKFALACIAVGISSLVAHADPQLDSWFTINSGVYARIYTTDAAKTSGTAVTTWSRGSTSQAQPAYCGIQAIYSSPDWIYLRTTGLGVQVMGPWYGNAARTMNFPNFPVNSKTLYRLPRHPATNGVHTLTGLGAIGYFVDGVAMFDSRDAFYWNGSSEVNGNGYWNRDAYVNESVTFDPGNAHQPGSGQYHYHANPPALRYLLGDHVDFNSASKTYSENTNPVTKHSPILGWVRDGYPIYGPYGFANATNSASGVRRMVSGYVLRNGQNSTDDLSANGAPRSTIPAWAQRATGGLANQSGPAISTTYPLGRYLEDKAFLGDLGFHQGPDFDLDEYNGRWCVTPEFPGGTYAYFVCITSNGTPAFPYNIGRTFYGNPVGNTVASIAETVTTNFVGGANYPLRVAAPVVSNSVVSLVWNATEGGSYRVESNDNLTAWVTNVTGVTATLNQGTATLTNSGSSRAFRVIRSGLNSYDQ